MYFLNYFLPKLLVSYGSYMLSIDAIEFELISFVFIHFPEVWFTSTTAKFDIAIPYIQVLLSHLLNVLDIGGI
jgi:hypothetical protein